MNKDNQHSVSFVSLTAVIAIAVLLIAFKYCILYVVTVLSAVWLVINYWDFLVKVWQTLPRDAM